MSGEKKKTSIIPWWGVTDGQARSLRLSMLIVLAVACVSLTFSQLGFFPVVFPGGSMAYAVVLLLPVALSALLLGTLAGLLTGLIAGCTLYVHAVVMPLDFYELTFITPVASIGLLTMSGLLLGLFFAIALRKDPSVPRRVIYILIVCFLVSWFYSTGFFLEAISSTLQAALENAGISDISGEEMAVANLMRENINTLSSRLGDMGIQAWIDVLLMFVVCILGDFLARSMNRRLGYRRLRGFFALRLCLAALLIFMVMMAVSFVSITQSKIHEAADDMKSEAHYLNLLMTTETNESELLFELLNSRGVDITELDEKEIDVLIRTSSMDCLLDGYTKEGDGTILVLEHPYVQNDDGSFTKTELFYISASDDGEYPSGEVFDDIANDELLEAIAESVETGDIVRSVRDDTADMTLEEIVFADSSVRSEIVYLYAEEADWATIVLMYTDKMMFADRGRVMAWATAVSFVLLAAVFAIVFQLLSRLVVRRIDEENETLARITAGDLDARAEVDDTLEFASLSSGINTTVDALKGWIAEAESRMDAELATAKAIQESALPRIFPPYPDNYRFDIYASMNAAREVGGDFYDFFLIGDDCNDNAGKLGFVVADVSGKGVPAALFMMKAKTQIRDYIGSGMELGEAITEVNRQLCDGNDEGMFVTAWVGVLDYATGHVDYVNAGHNPPLLWQHDGGWRWMREKSGPMLGVFDVDYRAHTVDCKAGDTFLLYTDGVTEAFDVNDKLYGEDRLLAVAEEGYRMHPRELLLSVRNDVALWSSGAEQSDDITMLTLEYGVPPEVTATLEIPAVLSNLEIVNYFLHAELDQRLCPKRTQNQLDIAVEELFVNVCKYAYPDAPPEKPGRVRIQRTYSAEPPCITVDLIDEGIPFDPLAKPDAVTPKDIQDVPIGGLGILMAKRNVDEIHYERTDGSNVVTIAKRW